MVQTFNYLDTTKYDVYGNTEGTDYAEVDLYISRSPLAIKYYVDATIASELLALIPSYTVGSYTIAFSSLIPTNTVLQITGSTTAATIPAGTFTVGGCLLE